MNTTNLDMKELEIVVNYINTISLSAKRTDDAARDTLNNMQIAVLFIENLLASGDDLKTDKFTLNKILERATMAAGYAKIIYESTGVMLSISRQTETACKKIMFDKLEL